MREIKEVRTMREYGRVIILLKPLMEDRKVTRNRLAKLIDVRFEVVNRLYEGAITRLDMDILAKICFVLDCEVGDILRYEPPV